LTSIQYVMFGHSGLFGDYFDIIRSRGGALTKVVVNIADPTPAGRKTFAQRLSEANDQLARSGAGHQIAVEQIDRFEPRTGERYVIGFRGLQLRPLRDSLASRFGLAFDALVHASAEVSPSVALGEGVIVNAGSVIGSHATLGEFCLVNRGATVGHDAQVAAFANVGPGANLASGIKLGRGAVVGIGATVIENVVIGDGAFVGAGAVVLRDVAPNVVVAGVPARVIKTREPAAPS
jgi:sugar O-acyltransferase (sialic acid O-acetyltransferase NeuD family)